MRPVVRFVASLSLLALWVLVCSPAHGKDCGERPTGKNPSADELSAAVEELSLSFSVPIEIVFAVGHRESGLQQWRANGSLVVNETDCGLGMMQLTGSTAELFDVERLKSDWRYNLEAGVNVLQIKWRRALRERWKQKGGKLPLPDVAILENWYYALSYYQGKRSGDYPGKIFDHMAKRPGRLARLLPAAVVVSNPDLAVEGFAYGTGFTALAGNRMVLDDGRTLKVATTLGTMGNPALLAELDVVLKRAEREEKRGKLPKAIRWYQLVIKAKALAPQGRRAAAAIERLRKQAQGLLAQADRQLAAGDVSGSLVGFDKVESDYTGLEEAEQAEQKAAAIRSDPGRKEQLAELEAEAQARFLWEKAQRLLAKGRALEGMRVLKLACTRYPQTRSGHLAKAKRAKLESDSAWLDRVEAERSRRQVAKHLALAQSYLANGLYDLAEANLKEARALGPNAEQATTINELWKRAERLREDDQY